MLIQGTADGLARVHNAIITKVYEFPVPKDLTAIIGERAKQASYCLLYFHVKNFTFLLRRRFSDPWRACAFQRHETNVFYTN